MSKFPFIGIARRNLIGVVLSQQVPKVHSTVPNVQEALPVEHIAILFAIIIICSGPTYYCLLYP